jgi:DNA polymerase III epsilon subunit-like protein
MDGHLLRYRQDVTYALIDLETFNLCLNFKQNRHWQVGVLMVKGEEIQEAHDIRIEYPWPDAPYLKIGKQAAEITRFNESEHSRLAIPHDEAFKKFWPLLQRADYIMMHNGLRFDLYLLKGHAEMMGVDWKWMMPKIIDTKAVAQGIKTTPYNPLTEPYFEYQYKMANSSVRGVKTSLSSLAPEYGIEYDKNLAHDAIYDLKVNLAVWNKLKYQIEI